MTNDVKFKEHVVKAEHAVGLRALARKQGWDFTEVLSDNEAEIRDAAAARGFNHAFPRVLPGKVPGQDGPVVVDYHIFAGEKLRIRDKGPAATPTETKAKAPAQA